MPKKLLVASSNRGKLAELRRVLADLTDLEVIGPPDVGGIPDVLEDGDTFEHNARKKAREIAAATGIATIADDSGLEVDALHGAPGVYSARYSGEGATDARNNAKLLDALAAVPDGGRTARFRCALAVFDPAGALADPEHVEHGTVEGSIAHAPRGDGGFGYDPLFVLEGDGRTLAELAPAEKDRVSHRSRAAAKMRAFLASRR